MPPKRQKASVMTTTDEDARACCANHEKMLSSGRFADVILVIGQKEVPGHKAVLAAGSPVFAAMFEQRATAENRQGRMVLAGLSYKIGYEVIRYLYSGRVHDIKNNWQELLAAAERFNVAGLKAMCENYGCETINEANVLGFLQLSHKHGASRLKKRAMEVVVNRAHSFCNKPEFKTLDVILVHEIVAEMAQKLKKRRLYTRRSWSTGALDDDDDE